MQLGVNYPWRDYGWDFGEAPPGWRASPATPRWCGEIDAQLQHLRRLGVSVLRWFVLGDGLTYGTGAGAPRLQDASWSFEPARISQERLEAFEDLLGRVVAANEDGAGPPIQLLPVLVDFHFCLPGSMPVASAGVDGSGRPIADAGWVKGGRADALTDASKRRAFLDGALEPLLGAAQQRPAAIYAWELINEPDWITTGWHPHARRCAVPEPAMRDFLQQGIHAIRRAGFQATTGFSSIRTLRKAGIADDIKQFHHYPAGWTRLEPHTRDPSSPAIIGEFATVKDDVWPELGRRDQTVLARLRLARSLGYPLVLPWSYLQRDRHSAWSEEVERDIRRFMADA